VRRINNYDLHSPTPPCQPRIVNRGGLANVSRQAHSIQNHIFIFLELDSLGRALGEARRSTSKARL
jgi:hypothetical protein